MGDFSGVLRGIRRGDCVRFRQDFYGGVYIEVSRRWLPLIRRRMKLSHQELLEAKAVLSERRDAQPIGG
jgi:hypothetical protein